MKKLLIIGSMVGVVSCGWFITSQFEIKLAAEQVAIDKRFWDK